MKAPSDFGPPKETLIIIDIKYPNWYSDHIIVGLEDEPERVVILRRHKRKQRHLASLSRAQLIDLLEDTITTLKRTDAPNESERSA